MSIQPVVLNENVELSLLLADYIYNLTGKYVYVSGESAFPLDISSSLCSRKEIQAFAQEAKQIGVQYVGLCCGNNPAFMREVAQAYGKAPPSCKYAPDIHQSLAVGDEDHRMTERQRQVKLHLRGVL